MLIRDRMVDLGILYSLKKDLERFWQHKAFKWEPLFRRHEIVAQNRPYLAEEKEDPKMTQRLFLETQEAYIILHHRIVQQRQSALDIIHFLGIPPPKHLAALTFAEALPNNQDIEEAIEELEVIAHYVSHIYYPTQTARYLVRLAYEWVISLFSRR